MRTEEDYFVNLTNETFSQAQGLKLAVGLWTIYNNSNVDTSDDTYGKLNVELQTMDLNFDDPSE